MINVCLTVLVKKLAHDRYFDVNKVYACLVEIEPSDKDLVPVKLKNGKVGYRSAKEGSKVRNLPQFLRAMLVAGTCYLKMFPENAPAFCQYLFQIIDADKDYSFAAVLKYDRQFRMFREHNPKHSWAKEVWDYKLKLGAQLKSSQQSFASKHSYGYNQINYQSPVNRSQFNQNQPQTSYNSIPFGNKFAQKQPFPCKNYNNGVCKFGFNCRFAHVCELCQKFGHGKSVCRVFASQGQPQGRPSFPLAGNKQQIKGSK